MRLRYINPRAIMVYGGALVVLGALLAAAVAYANYSQASLRETREQSAAAAAAESVNETPVKIVRVFPFPMRDVLRLPGAVEAREDIDLAAKTGGPVQWIAYEEGARLTKGEPVLRLDTDLLEANVERAEASHKLAELKFRRIKDLYEKGVESVDAYDDASASIKTALATLEEARVQLEYATLTSPIDGYLDRLHVDVGEYVNVGQVVMKIVEIDQVEIECAVPEKDIHYFQAGETATVRYVNGEPREVEGKVIFVARSADPASRTYPLKILVENSEHTLRPGMITRVDLERRRLDAAIGAPIFTLVEREDGRSVYVVEDGRAVERSVKIGVLQGGVVEIVEGLQAGDALVVVGQRELVDGEKVRVAMDVTDLARQLAASGRDISSLAVEAFRQ